MLSSTGCTGASLVAARAAADLHCPEKDISVKSREMGAYDANGCGKHASYVVRAGEVMPDMSAQDDLPAKMPNGED
ncbi:Hypothetical protein A7982_06425 [Minicystis rosea]|nr:Hypothetical protein A7982_06425 [Minicystis rosea]